MKKTFKKILFTLPLTIGIILTLIALHNLTESSATDYFDDENFWRFMIFAILGMPSIFIGIEMLSKNEVLKENL